jgi:outer membrane protein assembly factor BamB
MGAVSYSIPCIIFYPMFDGSFRAYNESGGNPWAGTFYNYITSAPVQDDVGTLYLWPSSYLTAFNVSSRTTLWSVPTPTVPLFDGIPQYANGPMLGNGGMEAMGMAHLNCT